MSGMTSGVGTANVLIAEAFRSALRLQMFIVTGIFALLGLVRLIAASSWPGLGQAGKGRPAGDARTVGEPEPPGRRLLRIGLGILWIFDGILQAQPAMPVGLPAQIIEPSASSSPVWVRHLVNWGATPAEAPAPAGPTRSRTAAADTQAALATSDTPGRPRPPARNLSRPARLLQSAMPRLAAASGRSIAAAGALGVVLVGVLPSAVASANPNTSPVIAHALNSSAASVVRDGTGPCRPAGAGDMLGGLALWRLARGSASWCQVQVLHVPIAYGSSG